MAGGKKAKQTGQMTERLFEASSTTYQANHLLKWVKTFPEFVPLRRLKSGQLQGFFESESEPDYLLLTRHFGACFIEVKHFAAKDRCTYGQSLHQYEYMLEGHELGYFCAYLILWVYNDLEMWTLHPAETIQTKQKDNSYSLIFERKEGLQVESTTDGQPLYYPVIGEWLDE